VGSIGRGFIVGPFFFEYVELLEHHIEVLLCHNAWTMYSVEIIKDILNLPPFETVCMKRCGVDLA